MGGGGGEGEGGGGGGLTNERPQTNHVITGPMRGLEKNCMGRGQRQNTQTDSVTTRPTRPSGEKNSKKKKLWASNFTLAGKFYGIF